jgi:hypothetical protein
LLLREVVVEVRVLLAQLKVLVVEQVDTERV